MPVIALHLKDIIKKIPINAGESSTDFAIQYVYYLGEGHNYLRASARVCTQSLKVINNRAIQLGDLPGDNLH